jgi:hypothetical protein
MVPPMAPEKQTESSRTRIIVFNIVITICFSVTSSMPERSLARDAISASLTGL